MSITVKQKASRWINILEEQPIIDDKERNGLKAALVYHTIHGVGFGLFYRHMPEEISQLEEEYDKKYICSIEFISYKLDGNYYPITKDEINIMEDNIHFSNLGTITHWMSLPDKPNKEG